VTIIIHNQSNY